MILGKRASNTVFQKQLHCYYTKINKGIPRGSVVKNLPAMLGTPVQSQSQEDPLEKGMAAHSSILTWRIPRGHRVTFTFHTSDAESPGFDPWSGN